MTLEVVWLVGRETGTDHVEVLRHDSDEAAHRQLIEGNWSSMMGGADWRRRFRPLFWKALKCQGRAIREMSWILLNVREKILSGKNSQKLFIVSCIFPSIQVFSSIQLVPAWYEYHLTWAGVPRIATEFHSVGEWSTCRHPGLYPVCGTFNW